MPGGKWIFVLIALWWIIQAVIQSAQKKQEKERLRKIAQQRSGNQPQARGGEPPQQQRASQLRPPRTQAREVSDQPVMLAPAQTGSSDRSKADLAARRQAQLEELRRRRAAARTGQSPVQPTFSRPGGGAAGSVTPIPPSRPKKPKQSPKSIPPAQKQSRKRLTHKADKPTPTRNVTPAQPALGGDPGEYVSEAFQHDVHAVEGSAYTKKRGTKPSTQRLLDRITSPQDLRDLIILREILDKPVGER